MGNNSNNKKVTSRSKSAVSVKANDKKAPFKAKAKKKNDAGRIAFLLFIVVLFIVILISTVFSDVMQIANNRRETQELNQKKQELLEEEKSLKSEVFKLQDPAYIERYAREKYLLTSEGEKILIYVEGDNGENNETTSSEKSE